MSQHTKSLFTIGHSTHELPDFLSLLARHGVTAVCDVRSQPTARLPHFGRDSLAESLRRVGIQYVFLGEELGARRRERECYEVDRADYQRIAHLAKFRQGLSRVRAGLNKYRVCLLCAEKEPLDCHRAILVSRYLRDEDVQIQHILADGSLEDHSATERRLVILTGVQPTLFEPHLTGADLLDRAYDVRGQEIAYRAQPEGLTNDGTNPEYF